MALEEIIKNKLEKVEKLKKLGINPYPSISDRTHSIKDALDNFDSFSESKEFLILAGRIMRSRGHGGSTFFDIDDGSGRIQAYSKQDILGEEKFSIFRDLVDVGDFIELKGFIFKTKREEKTLEVQDFKILSKAILPLPEKWHGLQDIEERYRKRYLDIIFNEDVKQRFITRFAIIDLLRDFFRKNSFMEVETPILQIIPGGATARPFKTHMNDLGLDLYLRVAPELYLKRLLVGGFERVFEIARNFRNEGMDREHNPEFDMLEAYAAFKDYNWMMDLMEELIEYMAKSLYGKTEIEYEGKKIDLKRPFKRVEFNQIVKEASGLDYDEATENDFKKKAGELGIKIGKEMTKGIIADEIYKKVARPNILDPVFVVNHPVELSPLTKELSNNPGHVERFQLLIAGFELMNAFSELNDPQDQRGRLKAQEKLRSGGDEEAQRLDEDFIEALEYGMPPAAGVGIGVDRLIALLTDAHSLREILLFPTMKSKD